MGVLILSLQGTEGTCSDLEEMRAVTGSANRFPVTAACPPGLQDPQAEGGPYGVTTLESQ